MSGPPKVMQRVASPDDRSIVGLSRMTVEENGSMRLRATVSGCEMWKSYAGSGVDHKDKVNEVRGEHALLSIAEA